MFKILLYDKYLQLKKTLNLKHMIDVGSFSGTYNNGLSDTSLIIDPMAGEETITMYDIVKITKDAQLIYS